MDVELTSEEIGTLLESLEYSKLAVRDAQGTPYLVRRENLARIDSLANKLRAVKKA